jgi:hypothetical protein
MNAVNAIVTGPEEASWLAGGVSLARAPADAQQRLAAY